MVRFWDNGYASGTGSLASGVSQSVFQVWLYLHSPSDEIVADTSQIQTFDMMLSPDHRGLVNLGACSITWQTCKPFIANGLMATSDVTMKGETHLHFNSHASKSERGSLNRLLGATYRRLFFVYYRWQALSKPLWISNQSILGEVGSRITMYIYLKAGYVPTVSR